MVGDHNKHMWGRHRERGEQRWRGGGGGGMQHLISSPRLCCRLITPPNVHLRSSLFRWALWRLVTDRHTRWGKHTHTHTHKERAQMLHRWRGASLLATGHVGRDGRRLKWRDGGYRGSVKPVYVLYPYNQDVVSMFFSPILLCWSIWEMHWCCKNVFQLLEQLTEPPVASQHLSASEHEGEANAGACCNFVKSNEASPHFCIFGLTDWLFRRQVNTLTKGANV